MERGKEGGGKNEATERKRKRIESIISNEMGLTFL